MPLNSVCLIMYTKYKRYESEVKTMRIKLRLFILFAFLFIGIILIPTEVFATTEVVEVSTYEELRDALENGKSVKLMDNIKITGNSVVQNSRSLGIAVIAQNDITIDGNGFSIIGEKGTVRTNIEIYAEEKNVNVTFKNIKIINAYTKGRALDTRTGNITLNLDKVILETTGDNNTQALTIGGPTGPVNVNITNNSKIEAKNAGYGIITYNPINMIIRDSTVTGYAALYMKSADSSLGSKGSNIKVKNSNLNGRNVYSGQFNNFAAVVFEDGGIDIVIEDSRINAMGEGNASQAAFLEAVNGAQGGISFSEPNSIKVSGKSIINAKDNLIVLLSNTSTADDAKITIGTGVVSNKAIPAVYLPEGAISKEISNGIFVSGIERAVTIHETKGGRVTASQRNAIVGETIMLTTEVESGYKLKYLKVITSDDTEVEVAEGKFVMPDMGVIVIAEFEEASAVAESVPGEKDDEPKMGSMNTSTYVWVTLAAIALVGILTTKKKF